ncbi:alkanesulfonate monooxygenase SsuD/methylene tetrahydromethanopterin reductase-like flavin-dependent oxidoreductase (luciferase family) [Motilibacter peucedani]|uniref:Alkanesulfonate monooxygenase SsuD/methylene tetrahydromethanopterin reductase-like flavin-dependent oxidoreductase (Luciferase family) n=1 Tax=Motilibacter peucedani TaxID=598650 RepID=A0A420XQZ4_9ACTN|nr:LLM class flavin-dependent oxidoreductase [Motilibacter peucedani]RKS75665.1 alkanesulfonate monooxygenase SsuD/methylene tetrahydromethanopterin reductase-like flavin-dependent oxidoreductase (luciferase family) [Motilibacter peucedani]
MDYGHSLEFGTFLTPGAAAPDRVLALAALTEQVGLDLVAVQDHPYNSRFLDTWTLLSVIAARTTRVRVAPDVANLPLRPPAVLARSVASLDLLTGGRVELGLGAGGFADAIAAFGGRRLSPRESVDALREGIAVIRAVWDESGGTVRVEGEHYRVRGAHPGPAPAHPVGIWVGAYKPRMLALTGELADGWLPSAPYAPPDQLGAMNAAIDEAAAAAGRDPGAVRRLYNVTGTFASGGGFLDGPAQVWAEQLAELALEHGTSSFVLMTDDADTIRRYAAEVAPAVTEIVEAHRAGGAAEPTRTEPVRTEPVRTEPVRARPGATPFAVVPTPDPGLRLSGEQLWDEEARPHAPAPDADRLYTPHEQASGRHLVDVHDHLRSELEQLREIVAEVIAGGIEPHSARSQIQTMTVRQNNWTAGVYCAQYCRVVTTHHSLEDASVFPHLRRADEALGPVLDRLEAEHLVIHDVLEGVDRALVAFVSDPDGPARLQHALDVLTDALLSHLSYEERELVEPLARLGFY